MDSYLLMSMILTATHHCSRFCVTSNQLLHLSSSRLHIMHRLWTLMYPRMYWFCGWYILQPSIRHNYTRIITSETALVQHKLFNSKVFPIYAWQQKSEAVSVLSQWLLPGAYEPPQTQTQTHFQIQCRRMVLWKSNNRVTMLARFINTSNYYC